MSKRLNILDSESAEEFDLLSAGMHAKFEPSTETERALVEQMIHHEWLMRRALRMQQHLISTVGNEADVDPKRMRLVVRYYRTHEKGALQARRHLDSMRKMRAKTEKLLASKEASENAESLRIQRRWEQTLKKMPTLSNWVN